MYAILNIIMQNTVQPTLHRWGTIAGTALVAYGIPSETVNAFIAAGTAILLVAVETVVNKKLRK